MEGITKEQTNKALKYIKVELGSSVEVSDEVLELEILKSANKIMAYCNRKDIPDALLFTVAEVAADIYRDTIAAKSSGASGISLEVSEIKEGDNSIKFASSIRRSSISSELKIDPYLAPYISTLRHYCRATIL